MQRTSKTEHEESQPIAVTGGTGFIGQHLLQHLDEMGCSTRALSRSKPSRAVTFPKSTQSVQGDLSSSSALDRLLRGTKTCIHLAGATKSVNSAGFHETNAIGTFNLAARAARAGVEHFVYLSSQAAQAPIVSTYAASKATSEQSLAPFASKMAITIVRPPAVIGPGDPMLKPVFSLIKNGWLAAPSEPRGRDRQFAIISVRDLVSEIGRIVQQPQNRSALLKPCSIGSTNWSEIGKAISETQDKRVREIRISPLIMRAAGLIADGVTTLTRQTMPISYGKVCELLAAEWTYDSAVQDAMSLEEILDVSLKS